ncbi:hypothetical protein RHGRI_014527 [Rhododendron griersonianum]|uniref:HAUS augmin-like complex subunit 3 N-terminal domain-containing protein n=1 Tax=Rhododendron griersonianum TaxID=479676 RepID=A0AAV6K9N2_9ERIC|nr:hypothetical protein RHGRI_014527 [Rhododendron griersonianum]
MSGARLCALLGELGYEGHGALDPDSFEWPFQYDDDCPILDWICHSLRPSNVLSPSEITKPHPIPPANSWSSSSQNGLYTTAAIMLFVSSDPVKTLPDSTSLEDEDKTIAYAGHAPWRIENETRGLQLGFRRPSPPLTWLLRLPWFFSSNFVRGNFRRDARETMSGARLCALLGELGYEGHGALDQDSFEWPFQYDDDRPILDWICHSLRPSNVLSPSEVSQLCLPSPRLILV